MTSEGNGRKNAQNDKMIFNTIYMKPDFPIIKKMSEKCNVNAPLDSLFLTQTLLARKDESFFKDQMKKYILLHTFLEIKPFRVQYWSFFFH